MHSDFPGTTVTLRLYFIGVKPLMAFFLTTWGAAFFLVDKTEAQIQGMRLPSWSLTGRNRLGDSNSEGAKQGKIVWINNTLLLLGASARWVGGVIIGTAVREATGAGFKALRLHFCSVTSSHLTLVALWEPSL